MERGIKYFASLICLLAAPSVFADWLNEWSFKPNLGVDVGMQHQDFKNPYGEGQFKENYPYTNFYLGTLFYKYLGLEVGYEHMHAKTQSQWYNRQAPMNILGFQPDNGSGLSSVDRFVTASAFTDGWHVNLEGYWPVCPRTKTTLTATAGASWLRMHIKVAEALEDNAALPIATWDSDRRAVARLGLGVRQMVTDNFGLRLQGIWENTSKLNSSFPVPVLQQGGDGSDTSRYTVKPEDSYTVMLGAFLQMA